MLAVCTCASSKQASWTTYIAVQSSVLLSQPSLVWLAIADHKRSVPSVVDIHPEASGCPRSSVPTAVLS
jgi:hypothetical protein